MTSAPQQAFGAAVRARRAELGITLDQLAQASGVSAGTLSRVERGTLNPSLHSAVAIAAALGNDVSELLSPARAVTVVRRDEGQVYEDADTGIQRTLLARPAAGVEVIRYLLPPHTATADFAPHRPHTVETFYMITGAASVIGDGVELVHLHAGDTAQVPGDQHHRLENRDAEPAALLLVTLSPR